MLEDRMRIDNSMQNTGKYIIAPKAHLEESATDEEAGGAL